MKELKCIEDIPNYLNLLMVKLKGVQVAPPQGSQPSGINLNNAPMQISGEYYDQLNPAN